MPRKSKPNPALQPAAAGKFRKWLYKETTDSVVCYESSSDERLCWYIHGVEDTLSECGQTAETMETVEEVQEYLKEHPGTSVEEEINLSC